MSDIAKIDKNFLIEENFCKDGLVYYNALSNQFKIYGLMHEKGRFIRMPQAVADTVNDGVKELAKNTAGGRLRFKTNSKTIAIKAEMDIIGRMSHFTLCGSAGFDVYNGGAYCFTFRPPYDMDGGFESKGEFDDTSMRDIQINFPLYSSICSLYIGLDEGAVIEPADEYRFKKPVVYYGSSITQGGCASRPGTSYEAIISRMLDCDYINLGFSGNGKAEKEIAEYIASLDMSVFVYDYDHNATTVEYLKETHEPMFKIIREKNPELPIVMVSRPDVGTTETAKALTEKRKAVIQETYYNAIQNGDTNVYFIDGSRFYDAFGANEIASVDGCHPNDIGFMCMAKGISEVLEKIL